MLKKRKVLLLTSIILIVILSLSIYVYLNRKKTSDFTEAISLLKEPDKKEDDGLKTKFETVIQDLFKNRNIAILNNDLEELKKFYDLQKNLVFGLMKVKAKKLNI